MMRKTTLSIIAMLLLTSGVAAAETDSTTVSRAPDVLRKALMVFSAEDRGKAVREAILDTALNNVDVANDLFKLESVATSPLGWLVENFNVRLKAVEGNDADEPTALGVEYDYQKAVRKLLNDDAKRFSGFKGSLSAHGNVTIEPKKNRRNFLETTLSLEYFYNSGGVIDTTNDKLRDAANELEDQLVTITDLEKLLASEQWQKFRDLVGSQLSDQYYLGAAVDAAIESDQQFDSNQFAVGVDIGLVPRGWSDSSFLGKINVVDYFPALIRVWSGQDSQWTPRGSGFPTFNLGLKKIFPQGGDRRSEFVEDTSYWRYDIETGFSSSLGRWNGQNVTWESNFRYYAEINPNSTIKGEGLDKFSYFVSAVTFSNGMFISYSTGKLPFDSRSNQIYEVGLSYRF